jgi:hypothetical protein
MGLVNVVKAYGRTLLFFVAVSLSWLAGFASGPTVDPVMDKQAPFKSVLYSATSLVAWVGVFAGGAWTAVWSGAPVGILAGLAWGFLVAPVVVVVAMRLLFPGISGRLQEQVDEIGRARRALKEPRQRAR